MPFHAAKEHLLQPNMPSFTTQKVPFCKTANNQQRFQPYIIQPEYDIFSKTIQNILSNIGRFPILQQILNTNVNCY